MRAAQVGTLTVDAAYDPSILSTLTVLREDEAEVVAGGRFNAGTAERLEVPEILVTFGSAGSELYVEGGVEHVPAAWPVTDFQTSGAGDASWSPTWPPDPDARLRARPPNARAPLGRACRGPASRAGTEGRRFDARGRSGRRLARFVPLLTKRRHLSLQSGPRCPAQDPAGLGGPLASPREAGGPPTPD